MEEYFLVTCLLVHHVTEVTEGLRLSKMAHFAPLVVGGQAVVPASLDVEGHQIQSEGGVLSEQLVGELTEGRDGAI